MTVEQFFPRPIELEIAYPLEGAEETWRILGYVSERDQDEERRTLGLM